MAFRELITKPIPDDYPNYLADPKPVRFGLRFRPWLLLGLLVVCFIPRAVMTQRMSGICPDGVLYIDLAKSLEAGDLRGGLRDIHLNTFPMILAALHRLGMDWQAAGMWWNVAMASFVVLPLFGWARRQFDDRVAIVASLLYAFHPKFIEWAPEIIRDPTFWFTFMLSIYLLWRAVTEVRIGLFIAAGLVMTASWLTRFEGLFLLAPLTLWTFWRWRALASHRGRLAAGAILSVTALPLALLAANLFVFLVLGEARAVSVRWLPLTLVKEWLAAPAALGAGKALAQPDGTAVGLSFWRMVRDFFPVMTRGLSPAFALLMFGGLYRWRHVWSRRDHQPLFYTAMAVTVGIWINLWYVRASCPRYSLSIVLMASVFAALGLISLTAWCARWADRMSWGIRLRPVALIVPSALVVMLGATDMLIADYTNRLHERALGEWVRREFGPQAVVVGSVGIGSAVGYYADVPSRIFPLEPQPELVATVLRDSRPDVLLLQRGKHVTDKHWRELLRRAEEASLVPVARETVPEYPKNVVIFIREDRSASVATRPGGASARRR